MTTNNTEIPWGELRAAISSGDASHLEAALESCHHITNEDRAVLKSYLEGKVRENPKLLDIWPVLFDSKHRLEESFDLLSKPDTPLVEDICRPCKGVLNSKPARLPLSYPFLYRAPLPMKGVEWDGVIWEEVMKGLDYARVDMKYYLLSPYNMLGHRDTPENHAIDRMGFVFSTRIFAFEARWYQQQCRIGAKISDSRFSEILWNSSTRRDIARVFNTSRIELSQSPSHGDVLDCLSRLEHLYTFVLAEGATSLLALLRMYKRFDQIRLVAADHPSYVGDVRVLWEQALRRLMKKAWDLRRQS